jgi:hypothetical protein
VFPSASCAFNAYFNGHFLPEFQPEIGLSLIISTIVYSKRDYMLILNFFDKEVMQFLE